MTMRFGKRKEDDGQWKIVYVSTGEVVTIDGSPMEDLGEHEAEECLGLLEAGELVTDNSEGP